MKFRILYVFIAYIGLSGGFLSAQPSEGLVKLLQTGQSNKIVADLQNSWNSQNDDNKLIYAYALMQNKDLARAKKVLASITESYPGKVAQGALQLLNRDNDADKTLETAYKAAKRRDRYAAFRSTGETYLYTPGGNGHKAVEFLKEAYELKTDDYHTLIAYGQAFEKIKQFGKATQQYDIAINNNPDLPTAYYMNARVYGRTQSDGLKLTNLKKAIELDPNFAIAIKDLAEHYYYKKDYGNSYAQYKTFLKHQKNLNYKDSVKYLTLLFFNKEYDKVLKFNSDKLKNDTARAFLLRLVAYSQYETGDKAGAKKNLDDLFDKMPKYKIIGSDYDYYAKIVAEDEGELAAIPYYDKAIAMDKTKINYYENIGDLYFKAKKLDKAVEYYQKLTAVDTANAAAFFKTGYALYYAKKYLEAEEAFRRVTDLNESAATAYSWQGKCLAKNEGVILEGQEVTSENYGAAKDVFEKYLSLLEGSEKADKYVKERIEAHDYLCYYYYLNVDAEMAKSHCEQSLLLKPDSEFAQQMLTEIANLPPAEDE